MTTYEENLITNNLKMAYDLAWKYYRKVKYIDYEELQSEAFVGLTKAAKTFNPNYQLAFSTYAYKVMQNEILMFLQQFNKNQNISIYTEISDNIELLDELASDLNIEEYLLDNICISDLYACIDTLPKRLKIIIQYKLNGMTMVEIGKKLNLSQPQISRDYHSAINKLKTKLKHWG